MRSAQLQGNIQRDLPSSRVTLFSYMVKQSDLFSSSVRQSDLPSSKITKPDLPSCRVMHNQICPASSNVFHICSSLIIYMLNIRRHRWPMWSILAWMIELTTHICELSQAEDYIHIHDYNGTNIKINK